MPNKKNHLSHIIVLLSLLLFAMCLTMNVLFGSAYNLYELSDKPTVIDTQAIPESITANKGGDNTASFKASFLNKNNSYDRAITKNICSAHMIAAIPEGIGLLLFLIIVFLFFFLTLFIILPDGRTLINQKVRLDN